MNCYIVFNYLRLVKLVTIYTGKSKICQLKFYNVKYTKEWKCIFLYIKYFYSFIRNFFKKKSTHLDLLRV